MKFHVGLPTVNDFEPTWATAVSLLTHHKDRVDSITIVDNAPENTKVAEKLIKFCKSNGVGYHPLHYPKGPCGAKDLVFRVSKLPTVCLDSHVLLAPYSLDALADAWIDGPALYHGVLINANGTIHATDLKDEYGTDGMRGRWQTIDLPRPVVVGGGKGATESNGGRLDYGRPIEISMHGCGLIACDPKHWPGFNPKFRGFGGEEGYIQDKMRQRGGKVFLVPGTRWVHLWATERPAGATHTPMLWDKARNQVIGAQELGLDISRIRAAFPQFNDTQWAQIVNGAEAPVMPCGSCNKVGSNFKTPKEWNAANALPDERFKSVTGAVIDAGRNFDKSIPAILDSGIGDLSVLHPKAPAVASRFGVKWIDGDSVGSPVVPCDSLVLGDHKSAITLEAELNRWAPVVNKRILFHCDLASQTTQTLMKFLRTNREWSVFTSGNSWVTITKDEADKVQPKSVLNPTSIYKFAKALGKHLSDGAKKVSLDIYESRLAECDMCPSRNGGRCGICSCVLDMKASMPKESCPLDKWKAV